MSERTLKRIIQVLGVLVVAWAVVTLVGRGDDSGSATDEGPMAELLASFDPSAVDAVTFTSPGGGPAVRLDRTGKGPAGWTVEGHPVDSAEMAGLLESLEGASTGGPVSVNPANHARMEVDRAGARIMTLEGTGGADTLLLGKAGPSSGTVYARLPGRDEVHLLDAALDPHAGRDAEGWRSKRMAAVDTAAVRTVEVSRAGVAYRLERADSSWTVDGTPADSRAVRSLLGELVTLRATTFPVADSAAAIMAETEATRRVTVRDAADSELLVLRIWEGEEGGASPTVTVEGPGALQPGTPFTYVSWRVDRVAPEVTELRTEDPG